MLNTHYTSHSHFTPAQVDGRTALQNADRFLVEKDADGAWQLADLTDRVVLSDKLESDFGFWKDAEIQKKGMLWNSTVRPLNGLIEADEVTPMSQALTQCHDHQCFEGQEHFDVVQPTQATLNITSEGAQLSTDWTTVRSFLGYEAITTNDMLIAGSLNRR